MDRGMDLARWLNAKQPDGKPEGTGMFAELAHF